MNLIPQLQEAIQQAFQEVFAITMPLANIRPQATPKEFVGTHTLVTFPFAKSCKQSPEQVAHSLGEWLKKYSHLVADYTAVKGFSQPIYSRSCVASAAHYDPSNRKLWPCCP